MTTIPPMPNEHRVLAMIEDLKAWGTAGWAKAQELSEQSEALEEILHRQRTILQDALGNGLDEQAWEPGEHWLMAAVRAIRERNAFKAKLEPIDAEFRRDGLWFSKSEHDAIKALTICACGDQFTPDYRGICPGCQSAETAPLRAQIVELEWQMTSQARCDSWQVESL